MKFFACVVKKNPSLKGVSSTKKTKKKQNSIWLFHSFTSLVLSTITSVFIWPDIHCLRFIYVHFLLLQCHFFRFSLQVHLQFLLCKNGSSKELRLYVFFPLHDSISNIFLSRLMIGFNVVFIIISSVFAAEKVHICCLYGGFDLMRSYK